LLDTTIPSVKQKWMLSKLVNYATALPKNTIKPLGRGVQHHVHNTGAYTYGLKSYFSTRSISYAAFAMHILY